MKLAIMQPYFFPYIGYFQLIDAVDKFVFYDDVNYIKGGWVNRNRLMIDNKIQYFRVLMSEASPYKKINEIMIFDEDKNWQQNLIKTIRQAYRRSPHLTEGMEMIEKVLGFSGVVSIAEVARRSILETLKFMGVEKKIIETSRVYQNQELKGKDRVLDICKLEEATHYVNAIGGKKIYEPQDFTNKGIKLSFIKTEFERMSGKKFNPELSILDLIFNCDQAEINEALQSYHLID